MLIHFNLFKPRSYQLDLIDALEKKEYRKILAIFPRRAGKDITCLNILIRQMITRPAIYYYIFPTYAQAKKAIWDSITNDGMRMLDYFPKELVKSMNSQEMKIILHNGSLFQLIGSENYNQLMGTNPFGVIYSEYALQNPKARSYIEPILAANGGWQIVQSTPRAKNHLWNLYSYALKSKDWYVSKLTLEDTCHIPALEIEKMRDEGYSEDFIQQEFYTSFDMGVEGAYYTRYLQNMREDGRLGLFPYDRSNKVHTAWDIGVDDATAIIFFQLKDGIVRIIDCYSNQKEGLEHYIKEIHRKPYDYGEHIAPHDIAVREWGSGVTRFRQAANLGINFNVAPNIPISDGIEAVRVMLSKCYINEKTAQPLLNSLESYRQDYDEKNQIYKSRPRHDHSSHYADAMRYLSVSTHMFEGGNTLQQHRELKQKMSGYQTNTLENFFSPGFSR